MSGATIPYHLRQNKAIDRNLFVDLLGRLGRWRNISDYIYIGFGGPYVEDFKLVHGSLRIAKMVSLEMDENTVKRQEFNSPISCITFRNESSGAFLTEHEFVEPSIVWFDYTSPKDIGTQLSETELLVRKMADGDIVRITVNCSSEPLGRPTSATEDLKTYRLARAKERLADYCPAAITADDVAAKVYPMTVLHAIENAAKRGMDTKKESVVVPLSCFTYADGQQMLSVTMAIIPKSEVDAFHESTRLKHWPFFAESWNSLRWISVPQLSAKERMLVESQLPGPAAPDDIWAKLGYIVGETKDEANELMRNFINYYRLYPWYSRVVL
jgi:hypothetical protein